MAAIYSNENFPLPVVLGLRERGHDVLTIQETGRAGEAVPETEVLAYASGLNRAVLTINRRDFIRLHLASNDHAGIVVCTFDPNFLAEAERVHQAITQEGDLRGKLVCVSRLSSVAANRAEGMRQPSTIQRRAIGHRVQLRPDSAVCAYPQPATQGSPLPPADRLIAGL